VGSDELNLRTLGLHSLNVSSAEIKESWLTLLKVWHPDRFEGDPKMQSKAAEMTKELNAAYQALRNYRYIPPRATAYTAPPPPRPEPPRAAKPAPPPSTPVGTKQPLKPVLKVIGFYVMVIAGYGIYSLFTYHANAVSSGNVIITGGALANTTVSGYSNERVPAGYEFSGYIKNVSTAPLHNVTVKIRIRIYDCPDGVPVAVYSTLDSNAGNYCTKIGDETEDDRLWDLAEGDSAGFANFYFAQHPMENFRWNYEIESIEPM
jgi:hypothetical protein